MASDYVVVTTVYPTTYGCHRGRVWSRPELIARSDCSRSGKAYSSRDEAVKAAREERNRSDWFTDACEPDDSDDSDDESDRGDCEYTFTNTDEPPYDSAVLENYDNDEEVLIEVMTVGEYEEKKSSDEAYLQRARMQKWFDATLEERIMSIQVRDAGRVYYAMPPNPKIEVKAELEILDLELEEETCQFKRRKVEKKGGDCDLKPFAIPENASSIKTLMYRGGKQTLIKFAKECSRMREDDDATATQTDLESVGLLRILSVCKSLEELHIQSAGFQTPISPAFIKKMLSAAPHLRRTLKVLSMRLFQMEPDALPLIGGLKGLERLDINRTFSAEHYQDSYDYLDDDSMGGGRPALPYDEPLLDCVNSLGQLKRLDLGNGDAESQRYLFDYMLSVNTLNRLPRSLRVTLDDHNAPEKWSSDERRKAARKQALAEMIGDESLDGAIHSMARDEMKT